MDKLKRIYYATRGYEIVVLTKDLDSTDGIIPAGTRGVIVEINPDCTYEVELFDKDDNTVEVLSLSDADVRRENPTSFIKTLGLIAVGLVLTVITVPYLYYTRWRDRKIIERIHKGGTI